MAVGPNQLDDLTTAILLLVLIEVRTALARHGLGARRKDDGDP